MAYNGHKNYDYWNVALWLYNDEGLYNLVSEYIGDTSTTAYAAAERLYYELPERTPDGVTYTIDNIQAAIEDDWNNYWLVTEKPRDEE